MFCKKCGSQLQDGLAFCPNCGNPIAAPSAPAAPAAQAAPAAPVAPAAPAAPKVTINIDRKKLFFFGTICLLALSLFFSLFKVMAVTTTQSGGGIMGGNTSSTRTSFWPLQSFDLMVINLSAILFLLVAALKLVKNRVLPMLLAAFASFAGVFVMLTVLIQFGAQGSRNSDGSGTACGYSVLGWFMFIFQIGAAVFSVLHVLPALKAKKE